jgi:phosphoribosylaminoimidazole carboxylase (NCAIR synthetase)
MARHGIPTARFGTVEEVGLPALVKSRRLGYDGKGQRLVHHVDPVAEGELAEEVIPFERELSILAVRGRAGDVRKIADRLIATKGVKHGRLTVTTTGKDAG